MLQRSEGIQTLAVYLLFHYSFTHQILTTSDVPYADLGTADKRALQYNQIDTSNKI